jgi:hypothetical protein
MKTRSMYPTPRKRVWLHQRSQQGSARLLPVGIKDKEPRLRRKSNTSKIWRLRRRNNHSSTNDWVADSSTNDWIAGEHQASQQIDLHPILALLRTSKVQMVGRVLEERDLTVRFKFQFAVKERIEKNLTHNPGNGKQLL